MYQSVNQLKEQINLLSEGQLNTLEEKIKQVTLLFPNEDHEDHNEDPKMESHLSKTEDSKKISELFEIMTKWDMTSQHLPILVTRLKSLKHLHEEAATFAQNLRNLQETQNQIELQLENQKLVGSEIKELMEKNMKQTQENIKSLEQRIEKLAQK